MVSKLKPKSALLMTLPLAVGSKVATDCGVRVALVREDNVAEVVLAAASFSAGFSPPTRLGIGSAVLPLPVVRKVCTGTQVVHAALRDERTVPLTTRRVRAALLPG